MGAMREPRLEKFRFYDDDAGEAASTPLADEDTNYTLTVDGTDPAIQIRILIQETGGADGVSMDDYTLQYEKNSTGGFINVPTSDGGAGISTATAGLSNDSATTNRGAPDGITDGSGSFVAGEQSTDGVVDDMLITANDFTEHIWGIQFYDANTNDADTFDFTVNMLGKVTDLITPRITISQAATASRLLLINPPGLDGGFSGGPSP
jgi:hypothetical protein